MTNKLTKAFKNKWIKALTSGKYIQGTGCLKSREEVNGKVQNTWCCLGVAANLCVARPLLGASNVYIGGADINNAPLRGYTKVPNILWGEGGIPDKLASMNDTGKSFAEIAEYIKENL